MRKKRRITKTAIVKTWFLFLAITAGLLTSCKDYDDDIDRLETDISELQSSLEDQSGDLTSVQAALTTQITTLKTQLEAAITAGDNAAKADAAAAMAKAVAAQTAVDNLATNLTALSNQLSTLASKADLTALQTQVGTLAAQITAINTTITSMSGDLTTIKNRLDAIDGEDGELANLKALIDIQAEALETFKALINGEVAELGITIQGLTDGVALLEGNIDEINTTVDGILADIEELQNSTVSLSAFESTVEEINDEIAAINSTLAFIYANMVTGVQFIPLYTTSDGHPLIYAPVLDKAGTKFASVAKLAYQVNPSSVSETNFEIKGLVKKAAVITKADSYIAVSKVPPYQGGVLNLNVNSTSLGTPASGELNFYALVLKNLKDGDATERLITSDYIVADQPVIDAADVKITKADPPTFTALSNSAGTPDWQVVYNNASGVAMEITSYFERTVNSVTTKVLLKDWFNIAYKYELESTSTYPANAYFEIPDQSVNIIKVKNAAAAAVNQVAKVKVSVLINGTSIKTGTIYVKAVDRIPTEKKVLTKEVSYVRGSTDISITADGFSEDLLINEIDNVGLSYTSVTVDSLYIDGNDNPVAAGAISFKGTNALGTGQKRILRIAQTLPAAEEPYKATLTYTTADGSKWIVEYKITLTDGDVDFNALKVSSYWNAALNTMYVYGKQVGSTWSLEGDLNDGFGVFATMIPTPAPTTGSALSYSSHSYTITGHPDVSITSGTVIKLNGSYGTYVEGTAVPVKVNVTYNNGQVCTHEFNVQFKNPIKIEYNSTIDILNQAYGNFTYYTANGLGSYANTHTVADYAGKSPWSGIKVTNLATGQTVTDYDDLSVLINISSMGQTPDVTSNLGFDWKQYVTSRSGVLYYTPSGYTLGYITWDYTGTVLTTPLNVNCNITYTSSWGQTFTTTDSPLKVTVTQP
jgi:predicted  nucleic acid-binding Zn-ribbon protein